MSKAKACIATFSPSGKPVILKTYTRDSDAVRAAKRYVAAHPANYCGAYTLDGNGKRAQKIKGFSPR